MTAALVSSSDDEITVIVTVGSALGVSPRDEVTLTASKKGAGCSVIWMLSPAAGAGSVACAKPGADTTMRRMPLRIDRELKSTVIPGTVLRDRGARRFEAHAGVRHCGALTDRGPFQ